MKKYIYNGKQVVLAKEFIEELCKLTGKSKQYFYKEIREFEGKSNLIEIDKFLFSKENDLDKMITVNKVVNVGFIMIYVDKYKYSVMLEDNEDFKLESAVTVGHDICQKIDSVVRKYENAKEGHSKLDMEIADVSHIIELQELSDKEILLYGRQLEKLYKKRRYYKDLENLLYPVYNVVNRPEFKKIKIDIFKAHSEATKRFNEHKKRVYSSKIRKGNRIL